MQANSCFDTSQQLFQLFLVIQQLHAAHEEIFLAQRHAAGFQQGVGGFPLLHRAGEQQHHRLMPAAFRRCAEYDPRQIMNFQGGMIQQAADEGVFILITEGNGLSLGRVGQLFQPPYPPGAEQQRQPPPT